MLKVLIIDDEQRARATLRSCLEAHCPEVEVMGEAESVEDGIRAINVYKPDAIFLDIVLSDGSGFNLLEQIKYQNYKIVFVTSHNQYAIKALRYSAFDYLLKPIDLTELKAVVTRLKSSNVDSDINEKLKFLKRAINNPIPNPEKIILSTANNLHIVEVSEIIHCVVEDNYTMFYLSSGNKILVTKTLTEYEDLLKDHGFIRVHRAHLVNFNFILKFSNNDGGILEMKGGAIVPVSSRKKDLLINLINQVGLKR